MGIYIEGVEVTQAIQFHRARRHLGMNFELSDGTEPSDNSVPFVAGKAACVRVYVRSDERPTEVTGRLLVQRATPDGRWVDVRPRSPYTLRWPAPVLMAPGLATAQVVPSPSAATYMNERSHIGSTINFMLPAPLVHGSLRLVVTIFRRGESVSSDTPARQKWVEYVDATLMQSLRIRPVLVRHTQTNTDGSTGTIPPPTIDQLMADFHRAVSMFPIQSYVEFDHPVVVDLDLRNYIGGSVENGNCNANWLMLNEQISGVRPPEAGWVRVGVLPRYGATSGTASLPTGTESGCAAHAVAVFHSEDPFILAHEVGHQLGLFHAPCGVTAPLGPQYPTYGPYALGSIGEYGLDVSSGEIKSPSTYRDLMSYCLPKWISVFHWKRLVEQPYRLSRTIGGMSPVWMYNQYLEHLRAWPYQNDPLPFPLPDDFRLPLSLPVARSKVVWLSGVQTSDGKIEIASLARLTVAPDLAGAFRTGLAAQLIGEEDQVLAESPVMGSEPLACGGCDGQGQVDSLRTLTCFVPDVAPGLEMRIVKDGETVWSRKAPSSPVKVEQFACRVTKNGGLSAKWRCTPALGTKHGCQVQCSRDADEWQPVSALTSGGSLEVPSVSVPSGKLYVRVVANDGFFSVPSREIEIDVPHRPPIVAICHPRQHHVYYAGSTISLVGSALSSDGKPVDDECYEWSLGRKALGHGREVFVTVPKVGKHKLRLKVATEHGVAEASVVFQSVLPETG